MDFLVHRVMQQLAKLRETRRRLAGMLEYVRALSLRKRLRGRLKAARHLAQKVAKARPWKKGLEEGRLDCAAELGMYITKKKKAGF
jgi:hypothetical protein